MKEFFRRTAANWICLVIGLLLMTALAMTQNGVFWLGVPFLAFAVALGADRTGNYRLLTPFRSAVFTLGCAAVCWLLVRAATAGGWDGLGWMVLALIAALCLAAILAAILIVRVTYLVRGQKLRVRETLARGWMWLALDAAALFAVAATLIFINL